MMQRKKLMLLHVFAVTCVALYWLHTSNNHKTFFEAFRLSNGYFNESTEVDRLIERRTQDLWNETKEKEARPSKVIRVKPLGPCPSTPPHLVGPLHVEFDWNRNMDGMREDFSLVLQEGGRYKPLDCIAQQKVAIIIPFRNRHEHLNIWLYYLHPILQRQQLDYRVYVINQHGEGTFNRAKLLNVGYVEALKEDDYDCFVFSDVDLVPLDDRNIYGCFSQPRHLAVAIDKFGFKLPYKRHFGGVVSFSKTQYLKINGFPNNYWGWGKEDDDMFRRVIFRGMSISRPDLKVGRFKMIKHKRDLHNEADPLNPRKLSNTKSTMNSDGISSLKYAVVKIEKDKLYTLITVDIVSP